MSLEVVDDLALQVILTKLGAKEAARVGCVNKRLKASAYEDSLWSRFCLLDLNLSEPVDPNGNPVSSFMVCYRVWWETFGMYPWPLVGRVKRCWDRLKTWLKNNFPEAEATLRKGATEVEIEELEEVLKVKLPTPTRILYRFCDGQEFDKAKRNTLGIIGGYSFFYYMVNVYLLPIREMMHYTREFVGQSIIPSSKYAVVAASSKITGKFFLVDCTNGQLYVGTRKLPIDGEMLPCVPNGLIRSVQQFGPDNQQDGMLLWLEEHCRRLEDGIIKLRGEGQHKSICLFPEKPPLCSTSVTNGVQVD